MQGIRTIVGEYYCFDTATLIVTIHFPMFSQLTLDSTTLFYFNLSNNAQQGNSTRTVDMWIGEVTPHLNDCSAHGLPSLTVSKTSASTETVLTQSAFFFQADIKVNIATSSWGLSNVDETVGKEQTLAHESPLKGKRRVNSEVYHLLSSVPLAP